MSNELNSGIPDPPVLVRPKNGEVVAPSAVEFRWEDVAGDAEYWLEMATDDAFEDPLLSVNVGESLGYTADEPLEDGSGPYFWRVRARNMDGQWGDYSPAESFAIESLARHEGKVADVGTPDQQEDLGPVPEMLKGVGAEVGAEVTGDAEYFQKEVEMGVAHEGLGAGQILGFVFAIITVLILIVVFTFFLVGTSADAARWESVEGEIYPQLRETEAIANERLGQYDLVDDATETYRIPVDEAMDMMAERPADTVAYSRELQLLQSNN